MINRKTEVYVVDIIKQVLKSPILPSKHKFNALLLLKDMTRTKQTQLLTYANSKILKRLFITASTPLGDKCLQLYEKCPDMGASADCYHVLLEMFNQWHFMIKD